MTQEGYRGMYTAGVSQEGHKDAHTVGVSQEGYKGAYTVVAIWCKDILLLSFSR